MVESNKKISIVIPVYNEELILKNNILKVFEFAKNNLSNYDWQIIISDNNSSDRTSLIAKELAGAHPEIKYFFISEKGKGRAVLGAWELYPVDINIFMDVDLSTDLSALPELIGSIEAGYDLALGSRNLANSRVKRSLGRKIISRILNLILKIFLGIKVSDTACGFKAINRKVLANLSQKIKNQSWFFDTELIFLAQKNGYKIKQIPVIWEEFNGERKSRGSVLGFMLEYIRGIIRLR